MARPMDDLPSNKDVALTAGVLYPVLWGVNLGVGNKPRAGASFVGGLTVDGDGSITVGGQYFGVGVDSFEPYPKALRSATNGTKDRGQDALIDLAVA